MPTKQAVPSRSCRAAATVIAREAGVRVEVFTDTTLGPDCTVAAHPDRFDELVALLVETGTLGGVDPGSPLPPG